MWKISDGKTKESFLLKESGVRANTVSMGQTKSILLFELKHLPFLGIHIGQCNGCEIK